MGGWEGNVARTLFVMMKACGGFIAFQTTRTIKACVPRHLTNFWMQNLPGGEREWGRGGYERKLEERHRQAKYTSFNSICGENTPGEGGGGEKGNGDVEW